MSGSSSQHLAAVALEDLAGMPDPSGASPGDILTVASVGPLQAVWGAGAFLPLAGGTMTGTISSDQAATTDAAFESKINSDTTQRFHIEQNGLHRWGPGGVAAFDTNLFRGGSGLLQTSGNFGASTFRAGTDFLLLGGGGLNGSFGASVGQTVLVAGLAADASLRYEVDRNGTQSFSDGTTSPTLSMRFGRIAADTLAMLDPAGAALPGKIHHQYTTLTRTTGGTFSIDATTEQIFLDTVAAGASNPQLPAPVDGRTVVVKDMTFNASVDNITIDTQGGEDIDGAASYVISTDGESITFRADGSDWFIISRYTP